MHSFSVVQYGQMRKPFRQKQANFVKGAPLCWQGQAPYMPPVAWIHCFQRRVSKHGLMFISLENNFPLTIVESDTRLQINV